MIRNYYYAVVYMTAHVFQDAFIKYIYLLHFKIQWANNYILCLQRYLLAFNKYLMKVVMRHDKKYIERVNKKNIYRHT